jgi:hypothetical protein
VPRRPTRWPLVATAFLHFQATSAFCLTACRLPTGVPCRRDPRLGKLLAEATRPFSIFGKESPFLRPLTKASGQLAWPSEGPAHRVWLPSRRREPFQSLGAYFISQRSWGSPVRASSSPVVGKPFPVFPPSLHFPYRPTRPICRATTILSHRESCIPYGAFRTINPERDLSALQVFSPLRFSLVGTDGKSISLFPFPSRR